MLLSGCGDDKRIEKDSTGKIISEATYKDNQIWNGYKVVDYKLNWNGGTTVVNTKEFFKEGKSVGFDEKPL